MPRLSVSELRSGMTLARAIVNANGMVILPEGTELTAELLDRVSGMSVETVYVKGESVGSAEKEAMLQKLDRQFRKVEELPYMAHIKDIMKDHMRGL